MKAIINGTEVSYRIDGEGKNKVLLLHGWGCDMRMMQPVADALKNEHCTLNIDLPGHGESERPPEPWGVPEYAVFILNVLRYFNFLPCSVVSHSFGCRIAAWIEATVPEAFEKIVFTGAAGIKPIPSEEAKKRSLRYRKLKKYCETAAKIPLLNRAAAGWKEKLRKKYGSRDYNLLDEDMRKTFVKIVNQDLLDLYEHFRVPTLLIWGDCDTETPLWMAKEMEKRIPDAGMVVFEGGSHFAYLEQIGRFNVIVREFLKGEK